MVRLAPRDRLEAIAEAAIRAFGSAGFRGTRMADVAKVAGVSSGSIFTYVETKEALFHLALAHGFGLYAETLPPLPLAAPPLSDTIEMIDQYLRRAPGNRLRSALDVRRPSDVVAELRGVVEERYDSVASIWPMLAVIERCAGDLPKLAVYYFAGRRPRYFDRLARYIEQRADEGLFRPVAEPDLTARVVTETVNWFAWKRHQGREEDRYDDERARATVVEFVCAALLAKP